MNRQPQSEAEWYAYEASYDAWLDSIERVYPKDEDDMALKLPVKTNEGDFKRCPAGNHVAVCNLVADVGMQPGSGQYPDPKRKLYIRFEIPNERVTFERDGKQVEGPLTIGSFYTASMNEKATLRKHLESWRNATFTDEQAAEFDVSKILGQACMLSVVETESGGKTYANIKSIASLPRGMTPPKAENALLYYGEDDRTSYNNLPQWLREKIDKQIPTEPHQFQSDPNGCPF